mmetsp:Transcript_9916/g.19547  ORF Transcript_9916/g.19547 Transcript_9916/m.19547 type:complete len:221 (+) Transcript_9916:819-1481(+)
MLLAVFRRHTRRPSRTTEHAAVTRQFNRIRLPLTSVSILRRYVETLWHRVRTVDANVPILAPGCTPRVANFPVLHGLAIRHNFFSETDQKNSMVDIPPTFPVLGIHHDAAGVWPPVRSIYANDHRSVVAQCLDNRSLVVHRRLVAGDGGDALVRFDHLVVAIACLPGEVACRSVVALKGDTPTWCGLHVFKRKFGRCSHAPPRSTTMVGIGSARSHVLGG